ncbi:MAG TPA: XrtA system polysaccharide chain length determinant [Burkholderiaceae bacterium]|nr:XrtA system polysaccharide chain length determinant [Burkholderiaceae bacterium]
MDKALEAMFASLHAMARHRWLALAVAVVTAIASAIGVLLIPQRYEAKARIYVDTQTALKPLMEGLTFQLDPAVQVAMLARTLLTRPNLERLVQSGALRLHHLDGDQRAAWISSLMTKIKLQSAGSDNLYEISYRDADPVLAQRVVESTVELFVQEGVTSKRRESTDAGRFIDDQIKDYEIKLARAEERLKDFKTRNFGATGLSARDFFTRLSMLSEEVDKLRAELNAATQARNTYRHEIEDEGSQLSVEAVKAIPALADLKARMDAQLKLVDEMRLRYTENHPDLRNARRNLAEAQAEFKQAKDAIEAQPRAAQLRKLAQTSNPVYQKLRLSLADTEAQIASLQSQLATKQAALDDIRSLGSRMPEVEAELSQLNRDYDVLRKNYDSLVARREAAALGSRLNESSRLAEFRVVEPARVSNRPVFPSRLHMALIGTAATLIASLLVVRVVQAHRGSVDAPHMLQAISGRPVVGVVALITSPGDERRSQVENLRFGLALLAFFTAQAAWLAWIGWIASKVNIA